MKDRSKFDLDLKYGQGVEGSLLRVLKDCTVEVKSDIAAARTGNLCVEFEQSGIDGRPIPSGIAVSTADFWAFHWGEVGWLLLPRPYLVQLARKHYKLGHVKKTGDNGNRSVLIPIRDILPIK